MMSEKLGQDDKLKVYLPQLGTEPDHHVIDEILSNGKVNVVCSVCKYKGCALLPPEGMKWFEALSCPQCNEKLV